MSIANDLSNGMGGLKFVATAPPGVGRLCRIPFYLESSATDFRCLVPGAALATTSLVSPIIAAGATAAGASGSGLLKTPQISWATLRVVGFEVSTNFPENASTGAVAELMVQDLKIGGGATLFVHEDYAPANIYAAGQDSFSGLRDYPILKSPNVAEVTISLFTGAAGTVPVASATYAQMSSNIVFSCSLVCEVLQDDNFGSHIPGPYARSGAMQRRGGSFVQ